MGAGSTDQQQKMDAGSTISSKLDKRNGAKRNHASEAEIDREEEKHNRSLHLG